MNAITSITPDPHALTIQVVPDDNQEALEQFPARIVINTSGDYLWVEDGKLHIRKTVWERMKAEFGIVTVAAVH